MTRSSSPSIAPSSCSFIQLVAVNTQFLFIKVTGSLLVYQLLQLLPFLSYKDQTRSIVTSIVSPSTTLLISITLKLCQDFPSVVSLVPSVYGVISVYEITYTTPTNSITNDHMIDQVTSLTSLRGLRKRFIKVL